MLQLGLGLGLGPGNGILSFFFFFLLCKCGGHHLLCSPGAWPALSMSHVSMTSSGMKRGEQSGSRKYSRVPALAGPRTLRASFFRQLAC